MLVFKWESKFISAPSDYSLLPNEIVLNFRGGAQQDRELSFEIQILADDDDTEPVENLFIDVSPVRNAIVPIPRLQVDICQGNL